MRQKLEDISLYGINEFKEICSIFGIANECDEVKMHFHITLSYIIEKDPLSEKRCRHFTDFWAEHLLDANLPWNPSLKRIIESVLSLPISST